MFAKSYRTWIMVGWKNNTYNSVKKIDSIWNPYWPRENYL
jgi:hypothetical protein